MKAWWILVLAALAGCAATPGSRGTSEQPVSQQASTSDARQRAKVHTELAAAYLQSGRLDVAQEESRIAIEADSAYAPAYNLLGIVHMYLDEKGAAEENFLQALRLAPGDPEINNNYGLFLCQTDRESKAIDYLMTAMKNPLYATPGKPLTTMGLCHVKMKDDRAAAEFFTRALRIDGSKNVQALFGLAEIYYRAARYDDARAALADLHKAMEPNSQSIWLALLVERKLGDRESEARYTSQLRRKFPGSPEYAKLMQGRYE